MHIHQLWTLVFQNVFLIELVLKDGSHLFLIISLLILLWLHILFFLKFCLHLFFTSSPSK